MDLAHPDIDPAVAVRRRWVQQPAGTVPTFFRTLGRTVGTLLGVAITLGMGSALLMGALTLARLAGRVLFGEMAGLLSWVSWMQRRSARAVAVAATLALVPADLRADVRCGARPAWVSSASSPSAAPG